MIEPGRWTGLTIMDIDPFLPGEESPGRILDGQIVLTIVGGNVVYEKQADSLPPAFSRAGRP